MGDNVVLLKKAGKDGKMTIVELMETMVNEKASDLHCTVGVPPSLRKDGRLNRMPLPPLEAKDILEYTAHLIKDREGWSIKAKQDFDLAYTLPGYGRFRINIYWQRGSPVIACRYLMDIIPGLSDLGIPEILRKFILSRQGLILVTGPTGHGKTTSLASMINLINENKDCNIITLEDPIEYVHQHKKSNINQREVGTDCDTFALGLRRILRQDPDVIMIGEMRDLESMSIAVSAAETGHLVFSTLHTNSAISSINRIVDAYPAEQQNQIRTQLADSLLLILSQRLIPGTNGHGRVLAYELLINCVPVQNAIRDKKTHTVDSIMQTSTELGMSTFDQSLCDLYLAQKITYEVALAYSTNQNLFKDLIRIRNKGKVGTNNLSMQTFK